MLKHIDMSPEQPILPEWQGISELFVALGDEQRQRILLTFAPGARLNVSQIVAESTLSRTAVSHHLRILLRAGALSSEKVGKEVYYWVNKAAILEALQRVIDFVREET